MRKTVAPPCQSTKRECSQSSLTLPFFIEVPVSSQESVLGTAVLRLDFETFPNCVTFVFHCIPWQNNNSSSFVSDLRQVVGFLRVLQY